VSVERIRASRSLVEVMDRVLDKGIVVVDRKVLFSLFRVQLFVLEARVVTISIDAYLEYAEAIGLVPLKATRHVTEYVPRDGAR